MKCFSILRSVLVWGHLLVWDFAHIGSPEGNGVPAGALSGGAQRFPGVKPPGPAFPSPPSPLHFPTLLCLLWEEAQKEENKQQLGSLTQASPIPSQSLGHCLGVLQAGSEDFPPEAQDGLLSSVPRALVIPNICLISAHLE